MDVPPKYTLKLDFAMEGMSHGMHTMMGHMNDGIEWEDTMPTMNSRLTSNHIQWIIQDQATQQKNMNITMQANVGDKIKIRLFNDPHSAHPMQHPIHLHGQRFVVLSQNGVPNDNLVWKDTVLVPAGSTVDILVDVTNPGSWMLHCHIAEHLTSGMMATFNVGTQNTSRGMH